MMPPQRTLPWWLLLMLIWMLVACEQNIPETAVSQPLTITIQADGETTQLITETSNVREFLAEINLTISETDEVDPPLFTPLMDEMVITIVRITESLEIVPRSIPFDRKMIRSEAMDADAPPMVVQAGQTGLLEETVRIVYRDGLEAERWVTQSDVIESAQDEIVMIGIGAATGNVTFSGVLAYISDGTAVLLRGLSAFPEQLNTGGPLDGRVFSLSPDGQMLLFTRTSTEPAAVFNNNLWVIETNRNATPRPLNINNVLWADWNPSLSDSLEIAYSTAISTSLPPGWEANNDLWLGTIATDSDSEFETMQLIEAYPATYGWWGGNYAWSPQGRYIAYSYADEVGIIDTQTEEAAEQRRQLQRFTEYNTRTDWVWVPTLSWSADGRFLAFTNHGSDDPETLSFDSWIVDTRSGASGRFIEQTGMWGHLHWATTNEQPLDNSQLAFLRTTNPLDSQRSSYTLWLMDRDGSNARQIYPSPGENSFFPITPRFMSWGPSGDQIAFIYNSGLYLFDLATQQARRITQDDANVSHPTWAPYGQGLVRPVTPAGTVTPTPEGTTTPQESPTIDSNSAVPEEDLPISPNIPIPSE